MKQPSLLGPVQRAADLVGGVTKLAGILGVKRPALYNWTRVPAERVLPIEAATQGQVSRHDLRPDLYPREEAAA